MNLALKPLVSVATIDSMPAYLRYVNSLPILSEEEEKYLLSSFFQDNNIESGRKIILHHLRLVVKIALECAKNNQKQLKDAISEGNIGLMEALTKFDPKNDVRFATYAMHWIRHRIQVFLIDSWSIVKGNKTKIKEYLFRKKDVKDYADISTEVSLDTPLGDDANSRMVDFVSNITHPDALSLIIHEENETTCKENLELALKELNEREAYIIKARYFNEKALTFNDLSKVLNISKERVRQIEFAALNKIKKRIPKMPV